MALAHQRLDEVQVRFRVRWIASPAGNNNNLFSTTVIQVPKVVFFIDHIESTVLVFAK